MSTWFIGFGQRLREARRRKDISMAEVAKHIGVKVQMMQRYEAGRGRFPADKLGTVCDLLDIELNWLLGLRAR